jgi:hypothetical protein
LAKYLLLLDSIRPFLVLEVEQAGHGDGGVIGGFEPVQQTTGSGATSCPFSSPRKGGGSAKVAAAKRWRWTDLRRILALVSVEGAADTRGSWTKACPEPATRKSL